MLKEEFTTQDGKQYRFGFGKVIASSLSGFIAGVVVTLITLYVTMMDK